MAVALSVSMKTWERAHATSAQCSASPTSCRGKMGRGESRSSLLELIPKPSTLVEEEIGARAVHICDRPHLSIGECGSLLYAALVGGHDVFIIQHAGIPSVSDERDSPRPIFTRQDLGDVEHCAPMVWTRSHSSINKEEAMAMIYTQACNL